MVPLQILGDRYMCQQWKNMPFIQRPGGWWVSCQVLVIFTTKGDPSTSPQKDTSAWKWSHLSGSCLFSECCSRGCGQQVFLLVTFCWSWQIRKDKCPFFLSPQRIFLPCISFLRWVLRTMQCKWQSKATRVIPESNGCWNFLLPTTCADLKNCHLQGSPIRVPLFNVQASMLVSWTMGHIFAREKTTIRAKRMYKTISVENVYWHVGDHDPYQTSIIWACLKPSFSSAGFCPGHCTKLKVQ